MPETSARPKSKARDRRSGGSTTRVSVLATRKNFTNRELRLARVDRRVLEEAQDPRNRLSSG